MAIGRRKNERQVEMWFATSELPQSPGHVFYAKLNNLLTENGFDAWVEELRLASDTQQGGPGIPPGVYFRMLLIGHLALCDFSVADLSLIITQTVRESLLQADTQIQKCIILAWPAETPPFPGKAHCTSAAKYRKPPGEAQNGPANVR